MRQAPRNARSGRVFSSALAFEFGIGYGWRISTALTDWQMIEALSQKTMARLAQIRVLALDLDGTLYLGNELFPFTIRFLRSLRELGISCVFVTNNSAASPRDYWMKLKGMGIETTLEDIYTSGRATIEYLMERGGPQPIFLLGTPSLHRQFQEAGFETQAAAPEFVVLGFDKTFTWEKFDSACRHLRRGVTFIATHPDLNCPLPGHDLQPDCGALAAALTAATSVSPIIIGKPEPHLYRSIQQRFEISAAELAMVGDRLETDIAAGPRNGIFTVLVLTGVTTRAQAGHAALRPDLMLETCLDLIPLLEQTQRD